MTPSLATASARLRALPGPGAAVRVAVRLAAAAVVVGAMTLMGGTPAAAAVSSADPATIAAALAAPGTVVTGASWESATPPGTPDGISDAVLGDFPTEGSSFAILTTGNVEDADTTPTSTLVSTENGGLSIHGDTSKDVSILKIGFTVAARMNCVRFDFRFLTEEYPEFVTSQYNDAFIAELDTTDWSTSGSTVTAPHNFAFDNLGKPITVKTTGATSVTAGPADTPYDGATTVLTAATEAAPGNHTLYLSIFDQGDELADSAVFVDNLVVGHAADPESQCQPGAAPKEFELTLAPATGTHPVGASHEVTAHVVDLEDGPVSGGDVLFEVSGTHTVDGVVTSDSEGNAVFSYTGTTVGDDAITACFDADESGTCDAGEPFQSVVANWTAAPNPDVNPGLANTGTSTGGLIVVGALFVAAGAAAVVLTRRRRATADQ